MSVVKTYILAPNFTYHPETSIRLGDIIQYADDPIKPLSRVPKSELKSTESHIDYEIELRSTDGSSLKGGIWATFLEIASGKTGGNTSDQLSAKYTIKELETVYFTEQPTDEEAEARVLDKRVQAAISAGLNGNNPVFMVTGLKIARGFEQIMSASVTKEVQANAEARITERLEGGTDGKYSLEKTTDHKHKTGQDIIFAYQLHIITPKGWLRLFQTKPNVSINVYKSPSAAGFLHQDETEADLFEVGAANEMALRNADEEIKMEAIPVKDDDEDCVCIVFGKD